MMLITLNGIGLRESVCAMLFLTRGASLREDLLIGLLLIPQILVILAFGGIGSVFEGNWYLTAEWVCVVTGR